MDKYVINWELQSIGTGELYTQQQLFSIQDEWFALVFICRQEAFPFNYQLMMNKMDDPLSWLPSSQKDLLPGSFLELSNTAIRNSPHQHRPKMSVSATMITSHQDRSAQQKKMEETCEGKVWGPTIWRSDDCRSFVLDRQLVKKVEVVIEIEDLFFGGQTKRKLK